MNVPSLITETDLAGLKLVLRGKVRDVYELDGDLLIVATDRVSAFDCVFPGGIPGKGEILTRLTSFWLSFLEDLVPHHLLEDDPRRFPAAAAQAAGPLGRRSMWVKRTEPIPVECVVRGRLVGSALREYEQSGAVGGEKLPGGLRPMQVLDPPLFTPATKATAGHDENVGFPHVVSLVGDERARRLRDLSLGIFARAASHALERGIVLVDTKFEFGVHGGEIILIDEVLTPDSSRFWRAGSLEEGARPIPLDKQIIRDYLERSDWNKEPPAPELPPEIVTLAQERYREAFEKLTGRTL